MPVAAARSAPQLQTRARRPSIREGSNIAPVFNPHVPLREQGGTATDAASGAESPLYLSLFPKHVPVPLCARTRVTLPRPSLAYRRVTGERNRTRNSGPAEIGL
jgi:hypothetical protein